MTSTTEHALLRFIKRRRKWLGTLLIVLVVGSVTLGRIRSTPTQPAAQWIQVRSQLLENHLGLAGSLDAATRLTLSAPFDSIVTDMAVTDGQHVAQGQRLLTLDTTQLDLQLRDALAAQLTARRAVEDLANWSHSDEVARARRALTRVQMELNDTNSKLAETRRLFERGIVARSEVDTLAQQAQSQQLELTASQAELQEVLRKGQGDTRQIAEMQLANAQSRCQILQVQRAQREPVAPFAGTVLRPHKPDGGGTLALAQPGIRVAQGTPLFDLVSMDRVKAVAHVDEADLHQLHEDMPVRITSDGFAGVTLTGHIASISAQGVSSETSGGSASYEVVVLIDPLTPDQRQQVRLGMSVQLEIVTYRTEHGLAVPPDALHRDAAGRAFIVYRRKDGEPSQSVFVTPGRAVLQGVEVSGMSPGYVELPATPS